MSSDPATDPPTALHASGPGDERDLILIPVYNDWASLAELLLLLDRAWARGAHADVLIVDDGSTLEPDAEVARGPFRSLGRIDVLRLRRNLAIERAIAVGLAYVEDRFKHDAVVVMDGDGEDDPSDVPRLLERLKAEGGRAIVFAERTRRSESWSFRFFDGLYKLLHRVLTGHGVRVATSSAIPRRRLASLVVVSELWSHYAAAVFRSRQPICTIRHEAGRAAAGPIVDELRLPGRARPQRDRRLQRRGRRPCLGARGHLGDPERGCHARGCRHPSWPPDLAIPGWATFTISCR